MRKKHFIWLSVALNIILILTVSVFVLKYEVEVYISDQFYPKQNERDSVNFFWPDNKKIALSLTFDDARLSQIDSGGISILDKYSVKGTFYVSPENIAQQIGGWKEAIKNGHDIGNHTTTHPCSINFGWSHRKTLENYSLTDISNDINAANKIMEEMLGIQAVSFAYPCGQTYVGQGENTKSYVPVVSSMFESGRLYSSGAVSPIFCDLAQLPSERLDNRSFDQILKLIEAAKIKGQWLILVGHDVGDRDSASNDDLMSSKKTIEALCKYASDPTNGIWIDNVHNIAAYIKEKRSEKPYKYLSEYKKPSGSLYSKLWAIYYNFKLKLAHYKFKIKEKLRK